MYICTLVPKTPSFCGVPYSWSRKQINPTYAVNNTANCLVYNSLQMISEHKFCFRDDLWIFMGRWRQLETFPTSIYAGHKTMSKNSLHSVSNNSNLKEDKQNTSAFNLFDVMTCTIQVTDVSIILCIPSCCRLALHRDVVI